MDLLGTRRSAAEFDQFVLDHGKQLLQAAYLITSDLAEAEELTQECLLRIARRWQRVRAMQHPVAYARRVLVNFALKGTRGRVRRTFELASAEEAEIEHAVDPKTLRMQEAAEQHGELMEALAQLTGQQRLVVVLRYFADLSEAQTAEALGCSVGNVKSTGSRALNRLRESLDESRRSSAGTESAPNGTDEQSA